MVRALLVQRFAIIRRPPVGAGGRLLVDHANSVRPFKPSCSYIPSDRPQNARSAEAVRDRTCPSRLCKARDPGIVALISGFAVAAGGQLTAFLRAKHAGEMTVADVEETVFAVIVYREEDHWEAALPLTWTFAYRSGEVIGDVLAGSVPPFQLRPPALEVA